MHAVISFKQNICVAKYPLVLFLFEVLHYGQCNYSFLVQPFIIWNVLDQISISC